MIHFWKALKLYLVQLVKMAIHILAWNFSENAYLNVDVSPDFNVCPI